MVVFEIGMLVCFGFAWPTSVYKSYTSKSISGKSVLFLYVILLGYMFGIANNIANNPNYVIIFYSINAVMVFIDLMLYYRNKKLLNS